MLEIVIGPMFSGKSTYALSYIRRMRAIGKDVVVIKPSIDNRYSNDSTLVTHDDERYPCIMWDIKERVNQYNDMSHDCYVIEEAQFFEGLYGLCYKLLFQKKNILVVGLDGCSSQFKIGEILNVIPFANTVTKLNAFCFRCKDGTLAPYSRRLTNTTNQIEVGGADKYIAVCLEHLINE
jgi:thymidine kinase